MSNATKCDRCGGFYEQGGKNVRQGWGNNSDEYDLCPDCAESFDAWLERGQMADTSERATESPEMAHDTREKLEADVRRKQREWSQSPCALDTNFYEVIGWLDRQAAITEREFFETACHGCERLGGDDDDTLGELKAERDELQREIATLKEHLAGNMERLRELTDANAEMAWRIQQLEKEVSR